jgi:hypothetical protein
MGFKEKGKGIMIMYRKLDCICGHPYGFHSDYSVVRLPCIHKIDKYPFVCLCINYDPAGHNPELENVLCPRCRLVRLEKVDRHYICIACQYVMLESQVLELVG